MEALIVNGVYGSGKTTMVEEMAEQLEHLGRSFGAIDLDWLKWFFVPDLDEEAAAQVGLANLADVVRNYSRAGVEYLLMSGTFADASALAAVEETIGIHPRVLRLVVPYSEIEARLSTSVTTGRLDDLRRAREQVDQGVGGIGDFEVSNEGAVPELARQILQTLGWV